MASRLALRLNVVARAMWHGALSWGRRRAPADPRSILIAHHLLLGDTLMLTPLLAKLRERYPHAVIVMATPKAIAPLYTTRPYGVIAIPFDSRDVKALKALHRDGGYDLAIVPGDNRHSWLALALGARWIVAFDADRPAYKNWPVDARPPYPNAPAAWGDMVAGLISGPPPRAFDAQDWPAPLHTSFNLPHAPYCVLHVGASTPLKQWPAERWAELAAHLSKQGLQVVWSGGKGEDTLVKSIDPSQQYPSYAGQLDLPQLWHLIRHAALLVCPDTGIAHLGRITGTPTVTLFGPGSDIICGAGDFWRNALYRAVIERDIKCRDQDILFRRQLSWVRRCGRSTAECATPECMHRIKVATVLDAINSMSNNARP